MRRVTTKTQDLTQRNRKHWGLASPAPLNLIFFTWGIYLLFQHPYAHSDTTQSSMPSDSENTHAPGDIQSLKVSPLAQAEPPSLDTEAHLRTTANEIEEETPMTGNNASIESGGMSSTVLLVLAGAAGVGIAAAAGGGGGSSGDNSTTPPSTPVIPDGDGGDGSDGGDGGDGGSDTSLAMNQEASIFKAYAVKEPVSSNNTYAISDFFTGDGSDLTINVDDPNNIFATTPTIDGNTLSFILNANTGLFDSAVVTLSDDTGSQAFSVTAGSSQMIAHTTFDSSSLSSVDMTLPLSALYAFNPTTSLYASTNTVGGTGDYNLSFNGTSISGELTSSDSSDYWLWVNSYPYDIYELSLSENGTSYDLTVSLDGTPVYTEDNIDTLTVSLSGISNPYLQLCEDDPSIVVGSDPFLADQWHLFNSEVIETWALSTGEGVTVGVVEDYFEESHEDLAANVSQTISSNHSSGSTAGYHATAVAGVISATGGNGLGVIGTAPDADIVSLSDVVDSPFEINEAISIYSNSWGPLDSSGGISTTEWDYIIDSAEDAALAGTSVLFANGNGGDSLDQSAYDPIVSSPFTLPITAVNDWGEASWYSELGSNIIAATYSDGGVNAITTTDVNNNYTNDFGGTSSATPHAAGMAALMHSVNSDLIFRDYISIFAHTSLKIDMIDSSWDTNLAGIDTSYYYGFGLINPVDAVQAALNGEYLISDHAMITETFNSSDFNNNSDGDSISFGDSSHIVEQVQLTIGAIDYTGGDENLQITLTHELDDESFSSTLLFATTTDTPQNYDDWRALSVQHFGESLEGTWTISMYDTVNNTFLDANQFEVALDFFHHDETAII